MSRTKGHDIASLLPLRNSADTASYLSGQVDAVAEMLKHGRNIADLERKKSKITKKLNLLEGFCDQLDSTSGGIVADKGDFNSRKIAKAIKTDKIVWACDEPRIDLTKKITLAQKFKISSDVPDIQSLCDFGLELEKDNLLHMPFDQMYIEHIEIYGGINFQFALFVDDWDIYQFVHYRNRWLALHVEEKDGSAVYATFVGFLVLLASRSTTVSPSDERGGPMKVISGEQPKFSHHLVKLRSAVAGRSTHGGHHAPPRLHWRRGHIRRQRHGIGRSLVKKVWIAPMLVGDAGRGVVTHDYQIESEAAE